MQSMLEVTTALREMAHTQGVLCRGRIRRDPRLQVASEPNAGLNCGAKLRHNAARVNRYGANCLSPAQQSPALARTVKLV